MPFSSGFLVRDHSAITIAEVLLKLMVATFQ